jgi:hypothetical protein
MAYHIVSAEKWQLLLQPEVTVSCFSGTAFAIYPTVVYEVYADSSELNKKSIWSSLSWLKSLE